MNEKHQKCRPRNVSGKTPAPSSGKKTAQQTCDKKLNQVQEDTRRSRRPIAYPSSYTTGRPVSRSGRIPVQNRVSHKHHCDNNDEPKPDVSPLKDRLPRIVPKQKCTNKRLTGLLASIGAVIVSALGIFLLVLSLPASITLNGSPLDVRGDKTIEDALKASGIKLQPGDLVAVDGSLLEVSKGEPFHATVNGQITPSLQVKLTSGDVVEVGNGKAVEEPFEAIEKEAPCEVQSEGHGAIHLVESPGKNGKKSVKTGKLSGITVETITQEPVSPIVRNVSPEVGNDKVIALTFDDGPWTDQTDALLDTLAANNAKATFFTVGDRIEKGKGHEQIKRAAAEGHQICTHSYDHARGSGKSTNLGFMSHEERIAEIEKSYATIEAATGQEASRLFRAPGGNFGSEVVGSIGPLIKAEIGWNIDSRDWSRPGIDAIVSQLEDAWSGSIVLMHDGGGDRSQTIDALKLALPHLKKQGYSFITIDELMKYPLS